MLLGSILWSQPSADQMTPRDDADYDSDEFDEEVDLTSVTPRDLRKASLGDSQQPAAESAAGDRNTGGSGPPLKLRDFLGAFWS